jgi:hypothetical protein
MHNGKDTDPYRLWTEDEDGYNWLAVANMVQRRATVRWGEDITVFINITPLGCHPVERMGPVLANHQGFYL